MTKKIKELCYKHKDDKYIKKSLVILWSILLVISVEMFSTLTLSVFFNTFSIRKIIVTLFYFYIFTGALVFFTRRPRLSFRIIGSIFLFISIINNRKIFVMGQPFFFADIKLARDAAQFATDMNVLGFNLFFVVALVLGILLIMVADRLFIVKYDETNKKSIWWPRIALLVAVIVLVPSKPTKQFVFKLINVDYTTTLSRVHNAGYIPVFVYDFNAWEHKLTYSKEDVLASRSFFLNHYEATPVILPNKDVDVIVIMSESFVAPNDYFPDLKLSQDVTPNLRKIQQEAIMYGTAYSPLNGGGTCHIEFSFMTGYSVIANNYSNALCNINQDSLSMVRDFNDLGFLTTGIHNFDSTQFYDRHRTFDQLGFKEAYFIEEMSAQEEKYYYYTINSEKLLLDSGAVREQNALFMSDEDMLRITYEQLDPKRDNFIMSINMQNHAPFYVFETHDGSKITFSDKILESNRRQLTNYFNGLYNTDQYMYDFLEMLKKRDKDTIVVFFGDHPIVPSFFDGVLDNDLYEAQTFGVPYYIWANFETEQIGRVDGITIPQIGIHLQEFMGVVTDRVKIASVFWEKYLEREPYEAYLFNYISNPNIDHILTDLILRFNLISNDDLKYRNYHKFQNGE